MEEGPVLEVDPVEYGGEGGEEGEEEEEDLEGGVVDQKVEGRLHRKVDALHLVRGVAEEGGPHLGEKGVPRGGGEEEGEGSVWVLEERSSFGCA